MMYNKVKETWRSNKKYTHNYTDDHIEKFFNEDGTYKDLPTEPDNWLEHKDFYSILSRELDKLPENQKMAFYLKEVQGEATEDICKIMDISITNLGVLIFRAKNNLRTRLERELNK